MKYAIYATAARAAVLLTTVPADNTPAAYDTARTLGLYESAAAALNKAAAAAEMPAVDVSAVHVSAVAVPDSTPAVVFGAYEIARRCLWQEVQNGRTAARMNRAATAYAALGNRRARMTRENVLAVDLATGDSFADECFAAAAAALCEYSVNKDPLSCARAAYHAAQGVIYAARRADGEDFDQLTAAAVADFAGLIEEPDFDKGGELREVLQGMTSLQKAIFAHLANGRSYRETADILGISLGKVQRQVKAVRENAAARMNH